MLKVNSNRTQNSETMTDPIGKRAQGVDTTQSRSGTPTGPGS